MRSVPDWPAATDMLQELRKLTNEGFFLQADAPQHVRFYLAGLFHSGRHLVDYDMFIDEWPEVVVEIPRDYFSHEISRWDGQEIVLEAATHCNAPVSSVIST